MILKSNVNLRRRFNNKFIVLFIFIILIVFLCIYHTIESVKNHPIAKTNKMEYNINEKILLEIENKLPQQIIMRGCEVFIIQEKKDGDWIDDSDGLVCNRDEIIRVFRKKKKSVDFISKRSGKYRIFIDYKMYRREAERFDSNRPSYLPKLYSNEFNVR